MMACILLTTSGYGQSRQTKSFVLSRIASTPVRNDFAIVAAKIRTGTDTAHAYKQLDTLLSRAYGDMFWMYGCAGLYYATADVLRPEYKAKIRWAWKHHTPYRGDTENHFLMYYGSLLLMSQEWPDLPDTEWFMGKSSKEIYNESKEYLYHWIDETVRNGMTEWSSPRYGYYYITPLVLLAEYTKDTRLKHRFEMMLEYILADYASDYLNGCYCGAHSRVGDDAAIDPRAAEITSYGEYFFEDSVKHLLPDVAFAAMTSFECPTIIRDIAKDRSQPYEQYSFKRGRQMIRYLDKWSNWAVYSNSGSEDYSHDSTIRAGALLDSTLHAPVYKYEYMTKDYCLGSMQGGIVQPIQQQSWSLVFNSDKPHNIITGLHPYVSAEELGMFFPEYPSWQLERIERVKRGYSSEDKWYGGSPYERIYQDKNVLVALYDLPDSVKYHHVDLFLPWNEHQVDSTKPVNTSAEYIPDWRVFKYDSIRVGVYPLAEFHEIKDPNGMRLRMSARHCGYVIYCESARSVSARDFIAKLVGCDLQEKTDRIYSKGDNGRTIDVSLSPTRDGSWLFKSMFLKSKKGSGILTMRYKGEKRVLDFRE